MIEMKKSGVDWIGEIPAHWKVKRLKDVTTLNPNYSGCDLEGEVSFVPMESLRCGPIDLQEIEFSEAKGKYTYFGNEDLLVAKVTPCFENGNIALAKDLKQGVGYGSSEIFVLRSNGILNKYLFYYTLTGNFQGKACSTMCGVGGLKRISPLFMRTHQFAIPPLAEQQAIADYLDEKTTEIDEQVALLEKKRESYNKLKRSLISKVVTRGLNPAVELKDSGNDWIGEIPAHWEVDRIKAFAKAIKGKSSDYLAEPTSDSYQVLSVESLRQDECQFYDYIKVDDESQICTPDDIVVIWDGAGVGEFLKAKDGALSSTIAKIQFTSKKVFPKYFWYWRYKIEYRLKSIPTGMGIPHLNPTLLNNYKIALPPIAEQQAIADYLDEKTAEIDGQIALIDKKIDTYKKLKQSLIDEVVTGKRKI